MASNEYCVARQRTRKREGEFRSIYFIVGGKVWNMDRGTGMRLRKVCPQCSTVIHARRSICECGHAFTLKREARNTVSSPAKRKRALESLEDTLRRQENNRIRMASMRSSETRHHRQYALCKCIGAPRVCTLVLFICVETLIFVWRPLCLCGNPYVCEDPYVFTS